MHKAPALRGFWFKRVYDMLFAFVATSRRPHTHTHMAYAICTLHIAHKYKVSRALNHIYCTRASVAMQLDFATERLQYISQQFSGCLIDTNLYLKIMFFDFDYVSKSSLQYFAPVLYEEHRRRSQTNGNIFDFIHSNNFAMEWSMDDAHSQFTLKCNILIVFPFLSSSVAWIRSPLYAHTLTHTHDLISSEWQISKCIHAVGHLLLPVRSSLTTTKSMVAERFWKPKQSNDIVCTTSCWNKLNLEFVCSYFQCMRNVPFTAEWMAKGDSFTTT